MALLADLGGQRLKLAASESAAELRILGSRPWPTRPSEEDWQWLQAALGEAEAVYLSSTRPAALQHWLQHPLWSERLRLAAPDAIPLQRTTTGTGSDRLLAAWAAWAESGRASLIADFGTAWTLDLIDGDGVFRGGAIGAGLDVQRRALAEACPHLDAPDASRESWIPETTARAVDCGVREAVLRGVEALADEWERSLGSSCVRYVTGGDAEIANRPGAWQHDAHLVLKGLARFAAAGPA